MAITAQNVFDRARSFLNEATVSGDAPAGGVFTNATLLVPLNTAYEDLQAVFALEGIRRMWKEAVLVLPANTLVVSDASSPPLPTDFLVPQNLWEKGTGTSERYQEMEESVETLPDVDQGQRLRFWMFEDDTLKLVGATRSVDVKLKYTQAFAALTVVTSPVLIRGSVMALALMTAAISARSRGVSGLTGDLAAQANVQIDKLVAENIKPRQRRGVRRRPFGSRRRLVYL